MVDNVWQLDACKDFAENLSVMGVYYKELLRRAWQDTALWFGSPLAWGASALTTICGLIVGARAYGWESAVNQVGSLMTYGLGGFVSAWLVIFLLNALRAPWLLSHEREARIAELEAKSSYPKAADWKDLHAEFEARSHTVEKLDADWNREGDIDHGWHFRGHPGLVPWFEAVARRARRLARRSRYCRSALAGNVLTSDDPIRVWLEAIRALTSCFQMRHIEAWSVGDDGTKIPYYSGYIGDVYGSSALLCLELASREDE